MNDIRRTILWVIFGFSLVLLWDQWQVHNGNKPTFLPSAHPTAPANQPVAPTASGAAALPTAASASAAGTSSAAVRAELQQLLARAAGARP